MSLPAARLPAEDAKPGLTCAIHCGNHPNAGYRYLKARATRPRRKRSTPQSWRGSAVHAGSELRSRAPARLQALEESTPGLPPKSDCEGAPFSFVAYFLVFVFRSCFFALPFANLDLIPEGKSLTGRRKRNGRRPWRRVWDSSPEFRATARGRQSAQWRGGGLR